MEVASVKKRCVRQTLPQEWGMKNKRWVISIVDWGIWRQTRHRAACRRGAPFILGWIGWHCWDGDLPSEAYPPGSQPKHKVTQLWTSDDLCGSVPLRSLHYEEKHVRKKTSLATTLQFISSWAPKCLGCLQWWAQWRDYQPTAERNKVRLVFFPVRTAAGETAEICPSSDGTDAP